MNTNTNKIAEMIEEAAGWEAQEEDMVLSSSSIRFDEETDSINLMQKSLFGDVLTYPMSEHALVQFANRMNLPSSARLIRALANDVPGAAGGLFNDVLGVPSYGWYANGKEPKKHLLRFLGPIDKYSEEWHARAVMGPNWTPLPITRFLDLLMEHSYEMKQAEGLEFAAENLLRYNGNVVDVEVGEGSPFAINRIRSWSPNEQSFSVTANMKVYIDGDDSGFSPGFMVSNSAISRRTFRLVKYVERVVCTNGMTVIVPANREDMAYNPYIRHDQTLAQMLTEVQYGLTHVLPSSIGYIDSIATATRIQLREPAALLSALVDAIVPERDRNDVLVNIGRGDSISGDSHTLMGVVNRLTYAAHASSVSAGVAEQLEAVAGSTVAAVHKVVSADGNVTDDMINNLFFGFAKIDQEMVGVEEE